MALVATPLPDPFSHSPGRSPILSRLSDVATALADAAAPDNKKQAHSSDRADFASWCFVSYRPTFPTDPSTLADYIAELASPPRNLKASTINRRCSAIARASPLGRLPDSADRRRQGDDGRHPQQAGPPSSGADRPHGAADDDHRSPPLRERDPGPARADSNHDEAPRRRV
jgi:hypothetical protein